MDKFFTGLKNITQKPVDKLYDLFNVTPVEESKGKKADAFERTGQKIGDFFEPTDEVRVRDVVRGLPEGFAEVIGRPILRSFAVLGEKVSKGDARAEYVPETEYERELLGLEEGEKASFSTIGKETRLADKDAKDIPVLDPALGAFVAMTDIFTGGRGKQIIKGLSLGARELKALRGLTKADDIVKTLTKAGMKANDAKDVAQDIAKATKTDEVTKILRNKVEPPKTPKKTTTKAVASEGGDVSRATDGDDSMKSIGEILEGRNADELTDVSRATDDTPQIKPKKDERRFITRTKAMAPEATDLLDGKKGSRSTQELIEKADELIKADPDKAESLAKNGTDDFAVAVASRLIDARVKEARKAVDPATQQQLWEGVADVANTSAKNLTEHGRAVQAASILGRMTPEGMVRFAARTIQRHNDAVDAAKSPLKRTIGNLFGTRTGKALQKVEELSPKQAKEITKEMERIAKIEDVTERAMAFQKLEEKIADIIPSSLYQRIVTVWKAGLLTGLKTSGLNIASNVSHSVTEAIKDVPASMVDRVASLFTGKRTLSATTKGVGEGTKEGISKGWRYFKTGFDERDIGSKLDYKKISFGSSKFAKAIQRYEETVFRALGTQDQAFYYGAKARSLYSQAIAQAKNAGKKGKEAKKFIEQLVAKPTDEMLKYATLDAETSVFQNKTSLGTAARAIQNLPGGQIVLPFGKTPSAVATQIINYSPVGIVKALATNIGKGKFDQRLFSQAMGRGITGTAIMWLGTQLFKNDMVSTGYPTSEKERELWELEGRQSNSVKIGGKWRNAGVLGPAGLLLVIGGHMQEGIEDTGSFAGGLSQAGGGFGSTLTDQSFLRGINQTIEAINDPNRSFNGWASSLAGSVVPTLVSDIARSTDKYERRTSSPLERMQSRIPGARQGLEPKVDAFGQKVETPGFMTTMFDATRPTQPTADPDDPILQEFQRLRDEGFLATPTQLGPNKGYESLTDEQNTYLWQIAGQVAKKRIEELMGTKTWGRLDDEQKEDAISDVASDVKLEARARVVAQAVEGLSDSEKRKKLAEMKEDGLLTRGVYNLYQSLTR